jgi:uncharacterized membrane protein
MKALLVRYSRLVWTLLLVSAAIAHFTHREFFLAYYPSYLPWPQVAVVLTALVEVSLALMLWFPRTVRLGWVCIAALMVCYLPVHMYVVTHYHQISHPVPAVPLWAAWIRLFMHVLLMLWPAWMMRHVATSP